jgi:hypothetical protein
LAKQVGSPAEEIVKTGQFATATQSSLRSGVSQWPMQSAGLVLDARFDRKSPLQVHVGSRNEVGELIARGEAELKGGAMVLNGGAFQFAPFAADEVLRRCQDANAFTIELWARGDSENIQPAIARLMSFGPEGGPNFSITARSRGLFWQMALNASQPRKEAPVLLSTMAPGEWRHVALTYGDSQLTCYIDGQFAQAWPLHGDLATWAPGYLMLGDSWDGDGAEAWAGTVGAVAIYDRALPVHELFRNYRRLRATTAR